MCTGGFEVCKFSIKLACISGSCIFKAEIAGGLKAADSGEATHEIVYLEPMLACCSTWKKRKRKTIRIKV